MFELWDGVDTELYRVSARGTGLRQLTRNNVNDFGPVWGPGGSRLAFTRLSGGANDVWTIRADGTRPQAADEGRHPRGRRRLGRRPVTAGSRGGP